MNDMAEADVLIVGRGGGSLEELWAFNEEIVARAIYQSHIPIVSAVGHETDFTIADFVADLRAATPTAAAELAVPSSAELRGQLDQRQRQLNQGLQQRLQRSRERLISLQRSPVLVHPRRYMLQHAERLDMLSQRLQGHLKSRLSLVRQHQKSLHQGLIRYNPRTQAEFAAKRKEQANRQLMNAMQSIMKSKMSQLQTEMRHLDALSPLKIMSRGYSLVYDEKEQKLVKSIEDVQLGDLVNVRVNDGQLQCQVWGMKEDEEIGE